MFRSCTHLRALAAGVFAATALTALSQSQTPANSAQTKAQAAQNYGKLPLSFEANQGQSDPRVKFLSRGKGYSLFLTDKAAVLALTKNASGAAPAQQQICHPDRSEAPASPFARSQRTAAPCPASGLRTAHDFSRADQAHKIAGALQAAEKPGTEGGGGFNPRVKRIESTAAFAPDGSSNANPVESRPFSAASSTPEAATDTLQMQLQNANTNARVTGASQLPGIANYFIGNDPAKWQTNIPTYAQVRYTGVYDGIDLVYYGNQSQLEYDFVVAPHANPAPIQLHFEGAKKLTLTPTGDLQVTGQNGQIAFHKPILYQERNGRRQPIQGQFQLAANRTVRFQIGPYDQNKPLVIDPVLSYSTYLGGSTNDWASAIGVDASGDAYVTGTAYSTDFPVKNPYQKLNNAAALAVSNVFVSKINPTGTAILYSTYLGGSGAKSKNGYLLGDSGNSIAVDSSGDAYVTGAACSFNFPVTKNAYQASSNGAADGAYWQVICNAYLTELNPAGSSLLYSTYLGGSGVNPSNAYNAGNFNAGDVGNGIAVDRQGDAYIVGTTESTDFPVTPGVVQSGNHAAGQSYGSNAFIAKFNPTSGALLYSTCLGGSGLVMNNAYYGGDSGQAIAVDGSGNAYVTGTAFSTNFPLSSAPYQKVNNAAANGAPNAFVAKLNASASALVYSTYLGGSGVLYYYFNGQGYHGDSASSIAVDGLGHAYVVGSAASTNFPTTKGAFQTATNGTGGGQNAFVAEFNPNGSALVYSTFIGGTTDGSRTYGDTNDYGSGIAVDAAGDAYVTGTAESANFPVTTTAYQNANSGTANAFLTKLNPSGSELIYSTYLGGSSSDYGYGIALDSSANAYVAGQAYSSNFPLSAGAYQVDNKAHPAGGSNAFIAKLSIGNQSSIAIASNAGTVPQGSTVTFTVTVSAPYAAAAPTGTVAFTIDGNLVSTVPLVSGTATYATNTLALGKHTVTAAYSGSAAVLPVATGNFYQFIGIAIPILAPAAGTYSNQQSVTITDATPGATIYYTSGPTATTPTTSSSVYSTPIPLPTSGTAKTVIEAIAVLSGYPNTIPASATYTFEPGTPTPTIAPTGGSNLTEAQLVTLSPGPNSPANTALYYTLNGATPTSASALYNAPFLVAANETVTAIAIAPGETASAPKTASFTFTGAPTLLAGPATSITASSATLNAFASTQGLAGTYYFQYGLSSTALTSATAKTALTTLPSILASANLTGLKTKTAYYFQFVVSTAAGTVSGPVLTFTTN